MYYDPSNPVGPVPPGVIQALPDQEGFTILIYNFMKRLKGKFKCPIFAGHELDLHRVRTMVLITIAWLCPSTFVFSGMP